MTDEQTTSAPDAPAAPAATSAPAPAAPDANETIVITAEVADEQGVVAEGGVAIQGDHLLLVARFADTRPPRPSMTTCSTARSPASSTSTACWWPSPTRAATSPSRS